MQATSNFTVFCRFMISPWKSSWGASSPNPFWGKWKRLTQTCKTHQCSHQTACPWFQFQYSIGYRHSFSLLLARHKIWLHDSSLHIYDNGCNKCVDVVLCPLQANQREIYAELTMPVYYQWYSFRLVGWQRSERNTKRNSLIRRGWFLSCTMSRNSDSDLLHGTKESNNNLICTVISQL